MKSANKTTETAADPSAFVAAIADPVRRADAAALLDLMKKATKCEPKMWGAAIVGFGSYHYRYESGREGEWMLTGFSA